MNQKEHKFCRTNSIEPNFCEYFSNIRAISILLLSKMYGCSWNPSIPTQINVCSWGFQENMCFNSANFLKTVVWTSSPKTPQSTASTFRTGEPARFPDDPQNIRRTYLVPSLPLLLRSLFLMVTYLTTSAPPCVEPSFFPKAVEIRELARLFAKKPKSCLLYPHF